MNPKVFVSYSWDNKEHEDWVISFTNKLRENGIDAEIDKFITQEGTVNLNRMMVEKINKADFTVIVMTENYASRSDDYVGGVGFESQLLLNHIRENPNKIIPILREAGVKSIPFYLNGYEYIDFTDEVNFDMKFNELLHKILKIDRFEKSPLGTIPDLQTRKVTFKEQEKTGVHLNGIIPNLRRITDKDKHDFMQNSFEAITSMLDEFAGATKSANDNFDFSSEKINAKKSVYRFYVNGAEKKSAKIWVGGFSSRDENIMISYDSHSMSSDNSFNESIYCDVNENTLELKPMMTGFNKYESNSVEDIAKGIWQNIVVYLK